MFLGTSTAANATHLNKLIIFKFDEIIIQQFSYNNHIMESKLSMIMSENENSSLMISRVEDQISNLELKPNKKANKVRTSLLVEVNKDNMAYLKNSTVMLNSELPKDIIKKFDQFEKKFDNPLILGSVRRGNRTNSAKLDRNSSELLAQKIKNINYKITPENNVNNENNLNLNLDQIDIEQNPLEFAEFLEKKKISCAHKKIKLTLNDNLRSQNSKKSIKLLADLSHLSQYSFIHENSIGFNNTNTNNTNSNNVNSFSYNSFNSNNKNFSFLINFLNEEEKRKLKILEGYDKLRGTAKLIAPLKKKKKIKVQDPNIRQYEELFELLEYKGINFKSKIDVRENLYLNKEKGRGNESSFKKVKEKHYPCSISPKRNSREEISDDDIISVNTYKVEKKNNDKILQENINNIFIPTSNPSSAKKNSVPSNSINPLSNKPPRMNSDQKTNQHTQQRYSSPVSKLSQEINPKIQNNYTSSSNLTSASGINKFVYERHPNSVSPSKNKIPAEEIPKRIEETQDLIDYDNYRNNLNTSVIQVKDDEQEDTSIVYDNHDSNNSNYNSNVINLKPAEMMMSNNRDFSSLSQIVYTSSDLQEFTSYAGTGNQNFMTGMTGEYTTGNYRTKHLSNNTHVIDNYEEYENLMNKMQTNNLTENSLYNNIRSNYSDNTMTNQNESEYITNSVNTSLSHNSNITKSLSYISKSSGESDI
jgi:hypothetical protein